MAKRERAPKHDAWYYRFPSDAGAYGPIRFDEPVTYNAARARLREIYDLARLPRYTEVWPYSPPLFSGHKIQGFSSILM